MIGIVHARCSAYDTLYAPLYIRLLVQRNKVSWNQASMCAGESHTILFFYGHLAFGPGLLLGLLINLSLFIGTGQPSEFCGE